MTAEPQHVLLVDDDHYAREALRALIARDSRTRVWDVVGSVGEAVLAASRPGDRPYAPSVVLLDVRLAEGERAGIEGIPALHETYPNARILVTSVASDDDVVLSAVEAGADGYVWKNETAEGIAGAVVAAAEGRFVLSPSIADRLLGQVKELRGYVAEVLPERREFADLTENVRKTLFLYCVAGLSAKEIADELQVSVNTVNKRIKAAYASLGASSRSEAFRRLSEGADA